MDETGASASRRAGCKGPVDQHAVPHAELPGRGLAQPEADPDRRRGRREQLRRARVVQPGHRHPTAQYAGFGRGVVVHGGVPVQMVFGDVEHHPGLGSQRRRPVQLKAGQLDGQHVGGLMQHVQHGAADVAAQAAVHARGDEHGVQHRRGGGLAVGAGDGQPAPRRAVMAGLVEPPGQLDVAPDRHTGGRGGGGHRRGRRETGAGDNQGVVSDVLCGGGRILGCRAGFGEMPAGGRVVVAQGRRRAQPAQRRQHRTTGHASSRDQHRRSGRQRFERGVGAHAQPPPVAASHSL